MNKIDDRVLLGLVSGLAGNVAKMVVDEVSLKLKISQRSFRATAAGVWVGTKRQADSGWGQLLGGLFDFGLSSLGGIGIVYLISKTGRDQLLAKGTAAGVIIGSTITAILSVFPQNKVKPKDAPSNLSYMLSYLVYGLTTISVAAHLGHPSIYDTKPTDDYLPPSRPTTEEKIMRRASPGLDPIYGVRGHTARNRGPVGKADPTT